MVNIDATRTIADGISEALENGCTVGYASQVWLTKRLIEALDELQRTRDKLATIGRIAGEGSKVPSPPFLDRS